MRKMVEKLSIVMRTQLTFHSMSCGTLQYSCLESDYSDKTVFYVTLQLDFGDLRLTVRSVFVGTLQLGFLDLRLTVRSVFFGTLQWGLGYMTFRPCQLTHRKTLE